MESLIKMLRLFQPDRVVFSIGDEEYVWTTKKSRQQADVMRLDESAIHPVASGKDKKPLSEAQRKEIRSLAKDGMSLKSIAKKVGVSVSSVSKYK